MQIKHGLLLCLFWMTGLQAADIEIQLDRYSINELESVNLMISSMKIETKPDLSPLEKDFSILSQSESTSIRIINGQKSVESRWQIELKPKRLGTLHIPALEMGQFSSKPLSLEVTKAKIAKADKNESPDIFIEYSSNADEVYVNSQVIVTVKLNFAINLRGAQLSEPNTDQVQIQKLGEDKQYKTRHNDRDYIVIERRYALFPEKVGVLKLPAIQFTGQVLAQQQTSRSRFFDDMFQSTRTIRHQSDVLNIKVKPQPTEFPPIDSPQAWWLPAQALALEESWSETPLIFRVGEPITRKITLKAVGLSANYLPPWDKMTISGFNIYADKPELETKIHVKGLLGQRLDSFAFIPQQVGKSVLPAIRLAWWDVTTNKLRYAEISEREIEVLPALNTTVSIIEKNAIEVVAPMMTNLKTEIVIVEKAGFWPWLSAALAIAWLLTIVLWLRSQKQQPMPIDKSVKQNNCAQIRQEIKKSCLNNEAKVVRKALMDWAKECWNLPYSAGFNDIKIRLKDDKVLNIIQYLDASLYAEDSENWEGSQVWSDLEGALKQAEKEAKHLTKNGHFDKQEIELYPAM